MAETNKSKYFTLCAWMQQTSALNRVSLHSFKNIKSVFFVESVQSTVQNCMLHCWRWPYVAEHLGKVELR
jgi:hypothetical protein